MKYLLTSCGMSNDSIRNALVDFTLYPHLDHPSMPEASLANLERWAAGVDMPVYLIDDQTALKVIDGVVEVISEGHWKRFTS